MALVALAWQQNGVKGDRFRSTSEAASWATLSLVLQDSLQNSVGARRLCLTGSTMPPSSCVPCAPGGSPESSHEGHTTVLPGASQVALVVKNLSANAEDRRGVGSILGSGR